MARVVEMVQLVLEHVAVEPRRVLREPRRVVHRPLGVDVDGGHAVDELRAHAMCAAGLRRRENLVREVETEDVGVVRGLGRRRCELVRQVLSHVLGEPSVHGDRDRVHRRVGVVVVAEPAIERHGLHRPTLLEVRD